MTIEEFVEKHNKEFNRRFFKNESSVLSKVGDFLFKPRYKVEGINVSMV